MPYASKAQQRFFHAAAARGDIPQKTVHEYDEATKGSYTSLPERVKSTAKNRLRPKPKRS